MHPKQKNTLEKSIARDGVFNRRQENKILNSDWKGKKPDEQKGNNHYLIDICYKYVLRG